MITTISYNAQEVRTEGSINDVAAGYKVWIDLICPTPSEILRVQQILDLDKGALEEYLNQSKKPQVRLLGSQKFVIALDMKFKDSTTVLTEGVYLFLGRGWLVTIHADNLDLRSKVLALFEQKNKGVTESSIDALFYSILANVVDSYEQLLTAIELTVTDFDQRTLYRPSMKVLEYLDVLSRQIVILRRHFWHMRDVINILTHTEENKEEIKYLRIVYDDINQLIQMMESYHDTINSTRELHIAGVSLQMSDAMKTLTVFSAILLPLTFISSLFGMNGVDLQNILRISPGFAIIIGVMIIVTTGLFLYFKNKKWILLRSSETFPNRAKSQQAKGKKSFDDLTKDTNNLSQENVHKDSNSSYRTTKKFTDKIIDSDAE